MNHEKSKHLPSRSALRTTGSAVRARSSAGRHSGTSPRARRTAAQLTATDEGRAYVPEIFARVIAGESLGAIARWLDAEGVAPTSGNKWWSRSLGLLVRNATYAGRRTDDAAGKTIHKCEALVDAATFRRAGEALDGRPKRGPANADGRAMLAGVLSCPRCDDSPMYRINAGGRGRGGADYYRCSGRGSQRRGCGNMVLLAAADALVSQWAANFDGPVMERRLVPGTDHAAELAEVKAEMRDLVLRDLADDEMDAELAALRAERDRLAALPATADRVEWTDTGETYAGQWAALDGPERGAWLRQLGVRVMAARTDAGACEAVYKPLVMGVDYVASWLGARGGASVIVSWLGSGIATADED